MKRHFHFLLSLLPGCLSALLLATSCDVHEFPDEPAPERTMELRLEFQPDCPLFQELGYENGTLSSRAAVAEPVRRYILRIFPESKSGENRTPAGEWVFYRDIDENPDMTVSITLPDAPFRLLAWSDIVEKSSGDDHYYSTGNFADIRLTGDKTLYSGADETRDAFRGDIQISADDREAVVEMVRPLAKFRFITNDLRKFIESEKSSGRSESKAASRAVIGGIDTDSYGVRVTYPLFMACSFNMFTDRPADSWSNLYFDTSLHLLNDDEAEICFDYVFVNTHDTSINVRVEVYDRATGTILARIRPVDVPLRRSHVTIVRGPFLTTMATGGAGIDPSFDNDFNIFIP